MLDLTCEGRITRFSMYHGFCDGQGISMFAESVLYHYYCMRDGGEYDPCGIRTDAGAMSEAEQLEAFQVKLVAKGGAAPGSIQHPRVYPVSGNRRLDTILNKIYQGTGTSGMTSLRRAYDYVSGPGFSYRSGTNGPPGTGARGRRITPSSFTR